MTDVKHQCSDAECVSSGKPSSRSCLCHQTEEQVLRAEMLAALRAMLDNYGPPLASIDYPNGHPISLARSAIAKASGEAP